MVSPEMLKIHQEFNEQCALLQNQKEESIFKLIDYHRITTGKKLTQDIIEQINKLSSTSEVDISCSSDEEINQQDAIKSTASLSKGKQRAIKFPNVLLNQRATKSLIQTSDEELPSSSKTRQPIIPNPTIKRCSQSIESENDAIQSKRLKLFNTTKQSLNAIKAPVSNPNAPSTSNVVTKTKFAICWKLYYQAKFKTFLLKNKITLSDNQTEMNTKWIEVKTSDKNKDIDFQ